MTKQQTEALRLADEIDANYFDVTVQCCATELRRIHARVAELEAELVKEAARTANYKLRAEQFEQRLDMANKMGNEARAEIAAIKAATHPTQKGLERQKIDPLRKMLAQHEAHLEQNPYAYFELAYTRRTGWMVWITDKPAFRESVLVNPDRKVLWTGQGDTPDEACENAALAAQAAKQGEQP